MLNESRQPILNQRTITTLLDLSKQTLPCMLSVKEFNSIFKGFDPNDPERSFTDVPVKVEKDTASGGTVFYYLRADGWHPGGE